MSGHLSGRIAQELSFYRVRDQIAQHAATQEGRAAVNQAEPESDAAHIAFLKQLGGEWLSCCRAGRTDAIPGCPAVRPLFEPLGIGGSALSQEQLLALGTFCRAAQKTKATIQALAAQHPIPHLLQEADGIPATGQAADIIFAVIDNDGALRDLPELRELNAAVLRAQRDIDSAIKKYTGDPALKAALQSDVPALRGDRQLLAVRADRRGDIRGIVHEVSASGKTLFIEPEEAVRANNELIQAQFRLQAQVRKILLRTTESLAPYRADLEAAHQALMLLDRTLAAAKWLLEADGVFAEDCAPGVPLRLTGARHPLLGKAAVPVTIEIPHGTRVLVITGANAGGKTVTLKTVALFALLNQAGFGVPAAEGTRLPVFSGVFADIGDDQSIDQSLSTFSSHMKNLALMLDEAAQDSLLLLDELASGTDPTEGGAIAMAILDALIERGPTILVTTHHASLKQYGYTRPACTNASVEFDGQTLRPTYHLVMGVPGQSHAVDVARNSGIPQDVIDAARAYLGTDEADVSALIAGLSQKHAQLDELTRQTEQKSIDADRRLLRLLEREEQAKQKERDLAQLEHSMSFAFLRDTRSKLENLVRELREGEITRQKTLAVRSFINDVTQQVDAQEQTIQELTRQAQAAAQERDKQEQVVLANGMKLGAARERSGGSSKKTKRRLSNKDALARASAPEPRKARPDAPPPQFAPGAAVRSAHGATQGTLVKQEKDGSWLVQFGSVKMNVAQSDLRLLAAHEQDSTPAIDLPATNRTTAITARPAFELRLLGMRGEEALKALERQLDACTVSGFKQFSVIHGKGNGVLQQKVHDYLSHYPGVKAFRFAPPEDGGFGKTYVEMQ